MQKCLNEDASYFYKKFTKHPWVLVLIIIFILGGISMFTVSLLCNVKFPCPDKGQDYMLTIGLNICLVTFVFICLPCIVRFTLNCIWKNEEPELPVIVRTRSPLSSNEPSRSRSRSNSREKIPPSPKGPVPKHGMKSFKEYHSEA